MPKISYASCPDLSLVISVQFTFKMCDADKNYKKTLKLTIVGLEV